MNCPVCGRSSDGNLPLMKVDTDFPEKVRATVWICPCGIVYGTKKEEA